jgi:hypothetical protein
MLHVQPRRLADGGIDYNHYRRRAHKLRSGARRRAVRRCWRLTHRLIVAAVSAGFRQRPQRPEIGEACRDKRPRAW